MLTRFKLCNILDKELLLEVPEVFLELERNSRLLMITILNLLTDKSLRRQCMTSELDFQMLKSRLLSESSIEMAPVKFPTTNSSDLSEVK